ncbi:MULTISPECIES: choline dehydrogenase [unclassified Bradyrhizobium]|uniref:choline dehydrogenase n=1 Tax=unclassified Bradyrhizobium TaxID=2631580 RepID=UPI0028E49AC9|nr:MULTISPECIES: choline dehydrogenase [unclassified Bradyrhizobium]
MPAAVGDIFMQKGSANWMFQTVPQGGLDARRLYQPRGRGWGGSSAINGMLYVRGHARDYDQWRQSGLTGWGYADVLPYFKRSEHNESGGDTWRGDRGPLWVSSGPNGNPLYRAFINAGRQAGHPVTRDFNGYQQEGLGPFHLTIKNGERCSAASAYLEPALRERRNLAVFSHAQAMQIIVENGEATGVQYASGPMKVVKTVRARREVILSAGVFQTPQLLMLSGIGPADELRRHGLSVVHDAPEIGQNLQDHFDVVMSYQCTKPITAHSFIRGHRKILLGLEYFLFRTGQGRTNHVQAGAFLKSRRELDRPDIQIHFANVMLLDHKPLRTDCHGFGLHVCQLRPESRGEVRLAACDPFAAPIIDPRYLSSEVDRRTIRDGVRMVRQIVGQDALRMYRGPEVHPGVDVQTDSEIDAWTRRTGQSIFHPVGTVRMGADAKAPVGPDLTLRGVRRLRIVDASVMPTLVGGNTNAATIMIAEKAADMVRGRSPLPREEAPIAEDAVVSQRAQVHRFASATAVAPN